MLQWSSEDEEDVERHEDDQDEEDLQHQLSVVARVLVDLAKLLLGGLHIVECFLSILVDTLHERLVVLYNRAEPLEQVQYVVQRLLY